jgi:4-amino-4-deoxychorismate lyase
MPAEIALRHRPGAGLALIETLRWTPGSGFLRLERHLQRLLESARELGFSCDAGRIRSALEDSVARQDGTLRVRLVLEANGEPHISTQAFEPVASGKVWNLKIAGIRLSSSDPLLRHKTTRRDPFVKARAEHGPEEADEVLLLNERGEVCEGAISTIFADVGAGVLVTPALSCGLLPGVLRAELIAEGRAREAVIKSADLLQAKRLFVGNSLRGLIPARMSE